LAGFLAELFCFLRGIFHATKVSGKLTNFVSGRNMVLY